MSTMIRINAQIRETTVNNLLKKKFLKQDMEIEKQREKVNALNQKLRDMAYEACFSKKQIERMDSLPDGWLPKGAQGKIRIVDPKDDENYRDDVARWAYNSGDYNRRIPYKNSYHGGSQFCAVIPNDHPYVKAKAEYDEEQRKEEEMVSKLRDEKHVMRVKAIRVIDSVTTVKRLLEIWPQIQDFLPEMVSGQNGQVPAYLIEDLNKEFGLD